MDTAAETAVGRDAEVKDLGGVFGFDGGVLEEFCGEEGVSAEIRTVDPYEATRHCWLHHTFWLLAWLARLE